MCWKSIYAKTFLRVFLPILNSNLHQITDKPSNVKAKDGILLTSLYGMTFMLSGCPILSPGVARRQEHPHYKCILGNDGTNKWILLICKLLTASHTVVMWVNGREGRNANRPLGHLAESFQSWLCLAWRGRQVRFECFTSVTPRTNSMWAIVFWCWLFSDFIRKQLIKECI